MPQLLKGSLDLNGLLRKQGCGFYSNSLNSGLTHASSLLNYVPLPVPASLLQKAFLKLNTAQETPDELDSVGLEKDLRICISNMIPIYTDTAGPWLTL